MDITPLTPKDRLVIQRYGDGGFVVNEVTHKGNIIITQEAVWPWSVTLFAEISEASLAPLLDVQPAPEILLIGAGAQFAVLPDGLRKLLRARGIAADVMDTGAACRTYGILVTEGRRMAAALIAV